MKQIQSNITINANLKPYLPMPVRTINIIRIE